MYKKIISVEKAVMSSDEGSPEAKLALRVKSKKSQNGVLRDLSTKTTVKELLEKLSELTGVPPDQIALLRGFPPRRISYNPNDLVESLGLQNQDTLIVELDTSGNPGRGHLSGNHVLILLVKQLCCGELTNVGTLGEVLSAGTGGPSSSNAASGSGNPSKSDSQAKVSGQSNLPATSATNPALPVIC